VDAIGVILIPGCQAPPGDARRTEGISGYYLLAPVLFAAMWSLGLPVSRALGLQVTQREFPAAAASIGLVGAVALVALQSCQGKPSGDGTPSSRDEHGHSFPAHHDGASFCSSCSCVRGRPRPDVAEIGGCGTLRSAHGQRNLATGGTHVTGDVRDALPGGGLGQGPPGFLHFAGFRFWTASLLPALVARRCRSGSVHPISRSDGLAPLSFSSRPCCSTADSRSCTLGVSTGPPQSGPSPAFSGQRARASPRRASSACI